MGTSISRVKGDGTSIVPNVVLLGAAQDGGVPQAGCSCRRCMDVHEGRSHELYPVALGITDADGNFHLIEASRTIARQLWVWSNSLESKPNLKNLSADIRSVCLTHMHLGHIDGLGQFGKESMNRHGVRLVTSTAVLDQLMQRGTRQLEPFAPHPIPNQDDDALVSSLALGRGVTVEFHRVPHRDYEGIGDMHAIVIRGSRQSLLFLPDHDTWEQTLGLHKVDTIRAWLKTLKVQVALLDGTFWSLDEIHGGHKRDYKSIPHPPISQTIKMLGQKQTNSTVGDGEGDPDIYFIHLNHTNPAINDKRIQNEIENLGWRIGEQGQSWQLG